ncbi:MAG: flavodoxin-dependent (E)-4-hydroxy-3-methylbut-2-enyl-diphosphate synthase, partial [Acidobacteria bacterium]|nr:flavodoxin-dependent (E)-4-hydroxy-3-methylbut-2-enyl-diphosphate synthase [Acidobacteriota bacterium]
INPGNYADTKRFKVWEYTDAEYRAELERIEERFKPLVRRAKERGVSLRIGTNHGSLSDRILNRYGDTPLGMVESALEFVRICERHGHRELILSMKSSNPMVMIRAYRLLSERMAAEGMNYPFHLGVTEAGDGEDGRIKSAVGIGALLEEGIGDTIRVSLTEDPVAEVPVAFALVDKYNRWIQSTQNTSTGPSITDFSIAAAAYFRREAARLDVGKVSMGGGEPVRVECRLRAPLGDSAAVEEELRSLEAPSSTPDARAEILEVDLLQPPDIPRLEQLSRRLRSRPDAPALSLRMDSALTPAVSASDLAKLAQICDRITLRLDASFSEGRPWLELLGAAQTQAVALHLEMRAEHEGSAASAHLARMAGRCYSETGRLPLLSLETAVGVSPVVPYRVLTRTLSESGITAPLLLRVDVTNRLEDPLLFPSVYLGSLLCDGIGDAVRIEHYGSPADSLRLAFNILQGTRLRLFKTEFISCPSCGRTQFDLEETTRRIKARTAHLKGVKIAIMGCIVNGPGEMADADFGYVGWGPGKVSLFVGKDLIEKDIPYAEADERLVGLIKEHGRWTEPPVAGTPTALPAGGARD